MLCDIFCYNNHIIPLSYRLLCVIKRVTARQNARPRDLDFIYLLEQIHISVISNVRNHLCNKTIVEIFHFITNGKHRTHMRVFLHVVRLQPWYFDIIYKYIDYRIYRHNKCVLFSVIPRYSPIWISPYPNIETRIYCETINVLNVSTTSSLTFFTACVHKLSIMLHLDPLSVLKDVIQPSTIPNPTMHDMFMNILYYKDVYHNICDYLEWFERLK